MSHMCYGEHHSDGNNNSLDIFMGKGTPTEPLLLSTGGLIRSDVDCTLGAAHFSDKRTLFFRN